MEFDIHGIMATIPDPFRPGQKVTRFTARYLNQAFKDAVMAELKIRQKMTQAEMEAFAKACVEDWK